MISANEAREATNTVVHGLRKSIREKLLSDIEAAIEKSISIGIYSAKIPVEEEDWAYASNQMVRYGYRVERKFKDANSPRIMIISW